MDLNPYNSWSLVTIQQGEAILQGINLHPLDVSDHKYNYSLPWKQIPLDRGKSLPRIYRAAELLGVPQGEEQGHRDNLQRTDMILRMERECAKCWELSPGSLQPDTCASPFLLSASLYPHRV